MRWGPCSWVMLLHLPPTQASLPLLGALWGGQTLGKARNLHLAMGLGAPNPLQCCGGGEVCRAGAAAPRALLG